MFEFIYDAKFNVLDYSYTFENILYVIIDKLLFLSFTERL